MEPREAVQSSADVVVAARDDLAQAEQDLADAEAALAAAQSSTSGPSASSTTTTTAPLLPPGTVDRVEQAESDLAAATEGITDETPLTEATAEFNAAAFSLEVAWLRLFADAGCLTDEQQVAAQTAVAEYTVALQTSLQTAGYYEGEIDGVYGPSTVDAVEDAADGERPARDRTGRSGNRRRAHAAPWRRRVARRRRRHRRTRRRCSRP